MACSVAKVTLGPCVKWRERERVGWGCCEDGLWRVSFRVNECLILDEALGLWISGKLGVTGLDGMEPDWTASLDARYVGCVWSSL